ncbi:MAG: glycosyltransferase family 39 protein [Lachnospiraceae bacterium]|nr:glycosyltransferase family 39 protein [Lachnospiraceae bacterium]
MQKSGNIENTFHKKKVYVQCAVLLFLLFAYSVILIFLCKRNDIWYDEAFGIVAVRNNIPELMKMLSLDVHPPLYYLLLKGISMLGIESFTAFRLLSAIPMISGLAVLTFYLHKRFSFSTAVLFLLLMVASPEILHFGVEMRMYGLAFFFVSLAAVFALELIRCKHLLYYILLGLSCVGAAYTHYFAGAAAVGICISTFIACMISSTKKRTCLIRWIVLVLSMMILYSPWLSVFLRQSSEVKNNFWLREYTLTVAKDTFFFFLSQDNLLSFVLILGLVITALIMFVIGLIKKNETVKSLLVLAFSCVFPPILGLCVSAIVRPVFQAKYALPVLGIYGMFLAISLTMNNKTKVLTPVLIVAALFCFTSFYPAFQTEKEVSLSKEGDRMVSDIKDLSDTPVFFHVNPQLMGCFAAYFPESEQYILKEKLELEYFPAWEEMGKINTDAEALSKEGTVYYVLTSYDSKEVLPKGDEKVSEWKTYRLATYFGFEIVIYKVEYDKSAPH